MEETQQTHPIPHALSQYNRIRGGTVKLAILVGHLGLGMSVSELAVLRGMHPSIVQAVISEVLRGMSSRGFSEEEVREFLRNR